MGRSDKRKVRERREREAKAAMAELGLTDVREAIRSGRLAINDRMEVIEYGVIVDGRYVGTLRLIPDDGYTEYVEAGGTSATTKLQHDAIAGLLRYGGDPRRLFASAVMAFEESHGAYPPPMVGQYPYDRWELGAYLEDEAAEDEAA